MQTSTLIYVSALALGLILAFQHSYAVGILKQTEEVLLAGNSRSIDAARQAGLSDQIILDKRINRGYRASEVAYM